MKKLVALLMILSLFIMSACSGGSQQSAQEPSGNSSEKNQTSNASDSSKKVLKYWYIDPGEKEKIYLEAVARFEEKNPDVKVEALRIPNDAYKQKLAVAMSGGNPPDVFHSWGGGWLKEFVGKGNVLDISDKIDKGHYVDFALANATFDGKVYGAPLGLSIDSIFYNKEIFDKYGLTPPKTYDELMSIIETLKSNNVYPFALANATKWPGAYFLMNFADRIAGPELFQSAFKRQGKGFDDPSYVKAGEYIQELVKADAFNPGYNGIPYDAGRGRQLMYSGKAAMMLMSNSFVNNVRQEAPDFEKKLGVFVFPTVPGGKGDPTNVGGVTSPVWSVTTHSQYPDLAAKLIEELTSSETAQAYADRTGSVTSIKGVEPNDEFAKKFYDIAAAAGDIHMPYDQTLPPELAELHKDTTQAIFGLDMTPQEAADKMEAKAKEILK